MKEGRPLRLMLGTIYYLTFKTYAEVEAGENSGEFKLNSYTLFQMTYA